MKNVAFFWGHLSLLALTTADTVWRYDLRTDGVPVVQHPHIEREFDRMTHQSTASTPLPSEYVKMALASGIDWKDKGAVTPAKDQGAHGYCGTFGRVGAAEGQYAIHSGHRLRNFSEEELVDCIGWDKDQFDYFRKNGFMSSEDYPYNTTGPDRDPPIPGQPCRYQKRLVINGTDDGRFTKTLSVAQGDEEQLAAWIFKHGPVNTGVDSDIFGLRVKGCEGNRTCFITREMCNDPKVKGKPIDHSILLTGFGTDPVEGPYWIVKNSWSTKFANEGFIKVARGFKGPGGDGCGHIGCCGWVPVYE